MALTGEQQRVFEWLNNELSLPVFASAYKGAVTLLNEKPDGYVSFVAHAGRDLMNSLATTVKGIQSGRVQYQQHLDELQREWRDEWRLDGDLSDQGPDPGHFIPRQTCQKISILVDEHRNGRLRSTDANGLFFSTFLDYADKDKIPKNFLSEWKNAKDWFLGHCHLRGKPFRAEADAELVAHFGCLDGYLYIAASTQYKRLQALNEILDATN